MKLPMLVALSLASTACMVNVAGDDDGRPFQGDLSGSITGDQRWQGHIKLAGDVTIEAGASVAVEPGTSVEAAEGATLRVRGALRVLGTAEAAVSILPVVGATAWAGIVAERGATVELAHAEGSDVATLVYCHAGATCRLDHIDFNGLGRAIVVEGTATMTRSRVADVINGGVTVMDGDLTITDSYVLGSSGDLVVQNGGRLVIEHAELGEAQGRDDHCVLHIGSAESVRITQSIIRDGIYGLMLGNTTGAVLTQNDWIGNTANQDVAPIGANSAVDLRFNYWSNGAPAGLGAGYDVSAAAAARIGGAGPRP